MQLEDNFNKAAQFIRSAATQGAELVVLPGRYTPVEQTLSSDPNLTFDVDPDF